MTGDSIDFVLSNAEIRRRSEACSRLSLFFALGAMASSFDLIAGEPLLVTGVLALVIAVAIAARTVFMRSLDRYAHYVWALTDTALVRRDATSTDEHRLGTVKGVLLKRTTFGAIRGVVIDFATGRRVYVNALHQPESFVEQLVSRLEPSVSFRETSESVDYDHPWFYRVLGLAIGLAVSSLIRVALNPTRIDTHWICLSVAAFAIMLGAYWLRVRPLSVRYGERNRSIDVALGLGALLAGVVAGAYGSTLLRP